MNIDMAALHAIEVDRGIPAGELLDTIKSALLTAYRHTAGHQAEAASTSTARPVRSR
jgi:N utilization substance protein A